MLAKEDPRPAGSKSKKKKKSAAVLTPRRARAAYEGRSPCSEAYDAPTSRNAAPVIRARSSPSSAPRWRRRRTVRRQRATAHELWRVNRGGSELDAQCKAVCMASWQGLRVRAARDRRALSGCTGQSCERPARVLYADFQESRLVRGGGGDRGRTPRSSPGARNGLALGRRQGPCSRERVSCGHATGQTPLAKGVQKVRE